MDIKLKEELQKIEEKVLKEGKVFCGECVNYKGGQGFFSYYSLESSDYCEPGAKETSYSGLVKQKANPSELNQNNDCPYFKGVEPNPNYETLITAIDDEIGTIPPLFQQRSQETQRALIKEGTIAFANGSKVESSDGDYPITIDEIKKSWWQKIWSFLGK